jgi:ATP-dependent RNA helicase DDX3X
MAYHENGGPPPRGGYVPPHLRNGGGANLFPTPVSDGRGPGLGAGGFRGGFRQGGGGFDGGRRYGGPPRGGGWGNAGADDRDPFAEDKARKQEVDALFQNENTGINFDAYEDIPVRTTDSITSWQAAKALGKVIKYKGIWLQSYLTNLPCNACYPLACSTR